MIRKQTHDGAVAVTFILPASIPSAPVSVVGNFNDWHPHRHPLIRRPDGSMSTTVICAPGTTVHFRYLGSAGEWFDDQDADQINPDGSYIFV